MILSTGVGGGNKITRQLIRRSVYLTQIATCYEVQFFNMEF